MKAKKAGGCFWPGLPYFSWFNKREKYKNDYK
jgi:hypothetical protein